MSLLLQGPQIEAHVARLTAIRTHLQGWSTKDARAADAIPAIDAALLALNGEAREPVTDIENVNEDYEQSAPDGVELDLNDD